ncbi:MAG: Gldg family protein [Deltaproteobacteria bacterium]|nr:Gldg family protein [Deltaproteobacteria bacterium]
MIYLVRLFKHEVSLIFKSPGYYFVAALFLFYQGIIFSLTLSLRHHPLSPPGPMFAPWFAGPFWFWPLLILVVVELSHNSISGERQQGTMDVLLSTGASSGMIILSKYLALLTAFIFLWITTVPLVILFLLYLPQDIKIRMWPVYTGYLGSVCIGGTGLAIGMLFSTITKDTRLSAMFTFMVLFLLVLVKIIIHPGLGIVESSFLREIAKFNFLDFMENFARGKIVINHIITILIIIVGSLGISSIILGKNQTRKIGYKFVTLGLVVLLIAESGILYGKNQKYFNEKSTIHPVLRQRISQLDDELKIYIFAKGPSSSLYFHPIPFLESALENISSHSGKVIWERPEITSSNKKLFHLARLFSLDVNRIRNDATALSEGVMVVAYGDDFRNIKLSSIFTADVRDGRISFSGMRLEAELSSAISTLISPSKKRICFSTGHEEKSILDSSPSGFSRISIFLKRVGYSVEALPPVIKPPDSRCALLIISAPEKDFLPSEIENLNKWIISGGQTIVMTAPQTVKLKNFWRWLNSAGVTVSGYFVGDKKFSVGKSQGTVWAGKPDVSTGLSSGRLILQTPLQIVCENNCESLIETSSAGYLYKLDSSKYETAKGVFTTAVVKKFSESRLTVLGFYTPWTNNFISVTGESRDNSLDFLEGIIKRSFNEERENISSTKIVHHHLTLRASEISSIQYFALLINPLLMLFFGIWIVLRRRRF